MSPTLGQGIPYFQLCDEELRRELDASKYCLRRSLANGDRRAFDGRLLYTEIVKIWLDLPDAAVKQLAEDGEESPWRPSPSMPTG